MAEVDFSLLRQPDFAAAALGGYQAGAAIGRQRRLDAALQSVDLEKPETIMQVLRADPQAGVQLLGASSALAKARQDTNHHVALTKYLTDTVGSGAAVTAGGMPGTSAQQTVSPDQARLTYMQDDPEGYIEQIGKLDESTQKRLADASQAYAQVGAAAQQLPYEKRRAYIQSQAGFLAQHGVTPDHISGFDPTDFNLKAEITKSLDTQNAVQFWAPKLFSGQPGARVYDENPNSPTFSVGGAGVSGGPSAANAPPVRLTDPSQYNQLPPGTQYIDPQGNHRVKGGAPSAGGATFP